MLTAMKSDPNMSEFIENAVQFYLSYLQNKEAPELINAEVRDAFKKVLDEVDHKRSSALFKLSVEISMLNNILAAVNDFDEEDLGKLRHNCIEEVNRINGSIKLEDAIRWQK